jgi:hypothetical protein
VLASCLRTAGFFLDKLSRMSVTALRVVGLFSCWVVGVACQKRFV